ncbi:MAG: hypothetical protein Kow00121_54790 [Elainellaceae cyanobacterium]
MSELCLLAASLIAQGQVPGWQLAVPLPKLLSYLPIDIDANLSQICGSNSDVREIEAAVPVVEMSYPEFSSTIGTTQRQIALVANAHVAPKQAVQAVVNRQPETSQVIQNVLAAATPSRPITGAQLYQQRLAALRVGQTYTRLPTNSFQEDWINATEQPTYQQWVNLLEQEAKAMAIGQGNSQLTVILGDSLSLWFPPEMLSGDRFWLNQGISGDTTSGILRRVSVLDDTDPDTIHVMVGINDLRQGATDLEVLSNLRLIMRHLRRTHPQAKVIVHSILPTRLASLPSDRIRRLNLAIASATEEESVFFLNLQPTFAEETGILRRELTTDGIHLSLRGYQAWEAVIAAIL